MTSHYESVSLEPDLFGALRARLLYIVVFGLVFAVLGMSVGYWQQTSWSATASLVVEDPRLSTVFEADAAQQTERYVQTQVGVLQSAAVATRASELLASGIPKFDTSAHKILLDTAVSSEDFSDLISVTNSASSPEEAEATANILIEAYLELRQSQALSAFSEALDELDSSIQKSETALSSLDAEIQSVLGTIPLRQGLDDQYREALTRLITLTEEEAIDPSILSAISTQLEAMQTILEIESQNPELTALLEEQRLAIGRLSELTSRRNQLAVDAELSGGGVVFQSIAQPAVQTSPGLTLVALLGLAAGLLVGAALAYGLEVRRGRFNHAFEPELVLRTPLLGDIPVFSTKVESQLPVLNAPQSQSAEAFRFVMAAIESQLSRLDRIPHRATNPNVGDRVILVTSAAPGDGRTAIVANMALAAAQLGKKVLVLDADFAELELTELLVPDAEDLLGITEIVVGTRSLASTVRLAQMGPSMDLSVLSRGSDLLSAQDVFASDEVAQLLEDVRKEYDLILIDSPPLHEVGYATTLARLADRVLTVVRHRSLVSNVEALRRRLTLAKSRDLGYVYTNAPMSGELRRVGKHTREWPMVAIKEALIHPELEGVPE